ncbi:hypothetical protein [Luteimonas sp. FCS-9]|uniref:XAC0095 family protein n=1 Tax=Luteimonas sp. FCS-9 TaxID=1547516 RepID=UPI00063E7F0D|nr:hypothetical protein [Luteimonas sp. FCS-9]KLI97864.1 hypothetical protein WQ56_16345 [Luteimonas sp. FCS-9]
MSKHDDDAQDRPGYFVPEASQVRLERLIEHMRFLSELAQPRSLRDEEEGIPQVRGGDVATCLELLAEQADQVLEAMAWRPKTTQEGAHAPPETYTPPDEADSAEATSADGPPPEATMGAYAQARAAEASEVSDGFSFGVTLDQADALDRLVQTLMAHGDVLASGHEDDWADDTVPTLGLAISEGADTVREILQQVQDQRLRTPLRPPTGVREPRPAYGAALH